MNLTTSTRTLDARATAAAFPLGGIGTGNVSLGARGELRDWEIFNRPAKGHQLANTFFAIRVQETGQPPITRVLEGPIQPPHIYSHGYNPSTGVGLPRFAGTTMRGEYPFATIDFEDETVPVHVQLEAFTPLIPLNPEDSGIPCAILSYTVTNTSLLPVTLTVVGSLTNPVCGTQFDAFGNMLTNAQGKSVVKFREESGYRGLFFGSEGIEPSSLRYGNMSLVTDHANVTVKPSWLRGGWWDYLQDFWSDLTDDGLLTDLGYDAPNDRSDTGSLGVVDTLEPGVSRSYRFVLTWFFPNRVNSWQDTAQAITRNHYATRFDDAWTVARYVFAEMPRLEAETRRFHDALFASTLPAYVLDAISANIVPVRSNTCFWLENGRFYGWEGCFGTAGCCPGTCTHVWSYAQTVAFLFPSLERSMREIEFQIETEPDGYMSFRNSRGFDGVIWAPSAPRAEAASDGQLGSILRAYREWQLSADKEWLKGLWPGIKRAIDYASIHWDLDHDHVLDGKQHNTYDIEFYGPNPLSGIYYLAGLRAVEELAKVMGEQDTVQRVHQAFERGSAKLDALLWNGEYYIQALDDVDAYRYQHGKGCLSDQLLGQLHACILGLGDLLPREHLRAAVQSIYRYNFRRDFRHHVNVQRTYVLNDEAGLVLCTWPHGGRPRFPFVYSDEVWTGIEYQVAAHLVYEGHLEEGLDIIRAVQVRHDGVRRNPWNEVECGDHYARSMSSWAVLLALSGMHADLGRGELTFDPVVEASTDPSVFTTVWSAGRAWGIYTQIKDPLTGAWQPGVQVLGGDLNGVSVRACGQDIVV